MGVGIVVIVLVIGFLYTRNHPPTRFRQNRSTGWNSYLHIAQFGLGFSLLGASMVVTAMFGLNLLTFLLNFLASLFGGSGDFPLLGTVIFTHKLPANLSIGTITSLLLGAAAAYGMAISAKQSMEKNPNQTMLEYEKLASDGLERLLFDSMSKGLLILVTLKSRKVYIGKVKEPRLVHGDLENIVIIPMLSGYRDKDDLRFKVSHNYHAYYEKYNIQEHDGELRLDHFRTIIPTAEIDSASLFDLQTYQQFSSEEPQAERL